MRTRIIALLTFIAVLSPMAVSAHPGHGTFDGINFWHYLTSPLHLISAMVVIAVAVFAARYFKKRQEN